MRVAVVGGGISGLAAADVLTKAGVQVVLYEKEDYLGGHARSVHIEDIDLDLGFMVFNRVGFPNTVEFFDNLGVEMEPSDMSFSVSLDGGNGYEWGSRNHLSSVFAQKKNLFNPHFWAMLFDVVKFRNDAIKYIEELENNPQIDRYETLGQFIKSRGYSELFHKAFLIPLCASIWSCPSEAVMAFSAFSVLSLLHNQHLLQLFGAPQWMTLRRRSCSYVKQVQEQLENRGCQIRTCCEVEFVLTVDEGCAVLCQDGSMEIYTRCIIAADAPNALKMLGKDAKYDEIRILGAFQYFYSDVFLHHDKNLMPRNLSAWGAWNFLGCVENKVCATYWLNVLQNLGDTSLPFLMTLNPPHMPEHTLLKWSFGLSAPTVSTVKASSELHHIQGKRGIWYCGAYVGCGFHEDGLKAGMVAAHGILRKNCALLNNPKPMVISPLERGARHLVSLFLRSHISTGCLMLLEEGGTVFTFQGTGTRSLLKAALKVHNPQFYSKVVTQAELGLAYAYIDGDFSVIDKDEGLINLLMILIANRDLNSFVSRSNYKRNRWRPLFSTVGVASAKYIFRHVPRQNNLIQSCRNISLHYDLNNDLFATFLDETMTYSCAVFERKDEDLKVAQLRKIANLIKKARIEKQHEVLEIGCGWGSLAIEVAQQTGCNYTGITFSEQQHRLAEKRVKEAGLQDRIKLLLCDYRQLPNTSKYDRIISCEMLEAVGHENMEEFFSCCEVFLAKDGLLILQFTSIPHERYDEHRKSSDFLKEFNFPCAYAPSLSRVTSAMASASRFSVEHAENIGAHHIQTLRCWKKNFLENQSQVLALGFDQKFIRQWQYYFDYCAAGFRTHTLGTYQIVFSRPGNMLFQDACLAATPPAS